MRILIQHKVEQPLELPINYHQIIQGIIYHNMVNSHGYSHFLHDQGYGNSDRHYRMFAFSLLQGKYRIQEKKIIFFDEVSFQVTSPDVYMLRILAQSITEKGITYVDKHYDEVRVFVADATVESEEIYINMLSPVCVYKTDPVTKKTYFFSPWDNEFTKAVNQNFKRKYEAYYGVHPQSDIEIEPYHATDKDKYVTRYKNFVISGFKGSYILRGERKYLDFLLQTGIGSKNPQGFGMFEERIF